jgi:hypothetical protein
MDIHTIAPSQIRTLQLLLLPEVLRTQGPGTHIEHTVEERLAVPGMSDLAGIEQFLFQPFLHRNIYIDIPEAINFF